MDNRMCTPLLREINQEKVRRFLMEFQTCTKMDIASQLGMSHPTVGKILSEMEKMAKSAMLVRRLLWVVAPRNNIA